MLSFTPLHRFFCKTFLSALVCLAISSPVIGQNQLRTPTEAVREFYKAMRDKRFRDAFAISIYKSALEGLSKQEYEDLLPDFEKMAAAVTEKIPENLELTGEQI